MVKNLKSWLNSLKKKKKTIQREISMIPEKCRIQNYENQIQILRIKSEIPFPIIK